MSEVIQQHGKALFWFFGLILPFLAIVVQMLSGFDSAPLLILFITWFGLGLLIYIGTYEE